MDESNNTGNASMDIYENDALFCSVERNVDSGVIDSGASFYAAHYNEAMRLRNKRKILLIFKIILTK